MQNIIKEAVLNNFNGADGSTPVAMAQTLYAARFIPSIISAGVVSVATVEINISESFVDTATFNATQIPTLDINDIEVIISGSI